MPDSTEDRVRAATDWIGVGFFSTLTGLGLLLIWGALDLPGVEGYMEPNARGFMGFLGLTGITLSAIFLGQVRQRMWLVYLLLAATLVSVLIAGHFFWKAQALVFG